MDAEAVHSGAHAGGIDPATADASDESPSPERVVVGVGGGSATINALKFGYQAALARDAELEAVLVRSQPVVMADPLGVAATVGTSVSEAEAESRLDEWITAALGDAASDPRIRRTILDGDPVEQLCNESEGAAMLVLGATTGLRRWMPGSVARVCEAKAPCAVVVVRKDTPVVPRRQPGRSQTGCVINTSG